MRRFFCLVVLVVSSWAVAQPAPVVCTWAKDAPGTSSRWRDGVETKGVTCDGVTIFADLYESDSQDGHRKLVALLIIRSEKDGRTIEVKPDAVELLRTDGPAPVAVKRLYGAQLAHSVQTRTRWANALDSGAGASSSAPIKDVDGIVVGSVEVPDAAARQAAADRARDRSRSADSAGEALTVNELKRNTVEPGHHVSGLLMFKPVKHVSRYLLRVPVDGAVIEFPWDLAGDSDTARTK